MPIDFNRQIIEEFRANAGQVGGPFEGARLLLLTTIGARSGAPHTVPLGYLPDGGERTLIIASAGGGPRHPAWYHNLVANPRVRVEDGVFTYEADAVVLTGDERDHVFARAAEADPGWANYQAKTTRVIPVVALRSVSGGPNATSLATALKVLHDAFRRELTLIRKEVADSGPRLGAQLRVNCLTLCGGLHHHHTGEDTGLFAVLEQRYPELGHTLDRLRQEHQRISSVLEDLQAILSEEGADPLQVRAEVERLTEELENHLTYEEDQLIPVLEASTP
ncbi:nitroreductase/quinone reductase family protein [Actinopolymorpha pittospori]